jgi:ankyrin repeat protein
MRAVRGGHKEIARLLLDAGANVNSHIDTQVRVLAEAEMGGHEDIVRMLRDRSTRTRTSPP